MSSGLLGFYYTPCMSRALLLTHYYLVMREQQQTDSTGGHVLGPGRTGAGGLATLPLAVAFLTRASILILYICVLRTISRTLNVVGGLGSVLSLLPTLVSAMATATAAVVVQVAAVVVDWHGRCATAAQFGHGASFPVSSSLGSMLKRSCAYALMPTLTGRTHLRTQAPRAR